MTDLTRYWHDESVHLEPCECMVPDSTLQDIADAYWAWQDAPLLEMNDKQREFHTRMRGLVNDE